MKIDHSPKYLGLFAMSVLPLFPVLLIYMASQRLPVRDIATTDFK
jgi:hypothetical protein